MVEKILNERSLNMQIKYKKSSEDLPDLKRHSEGAAGFDLYNIEDVIIRGGEQPFKIQTGISLEIPEGYYGRIENRSSLINKMWVVQSVIDSDYRGEIHILAFFREEAELIPKNTRIAQLVIMPCFTGELIESKELATSKRDKGGFGSTNG